MERLTPPSPSPPPSMQTVMRTRPHTLERDAMAPNMDGETDGDNVSVSGGSVGRGGTLDLDKIDEDAGVYTSFIVSGCAHQWEGGKRGPLLPSPTQFLRFPLLPAPSLVVQPPPHP